MQKTIKKFIEEKLFNFFNKDGVERDEFDKLISEYASQVVGTAKGIVLEWRYFNNKNYWTCLRKLEKINYYTGKDNFYRLVNEIINDIAIRASYKRLLNPYEFELVGWVMTKQEAIELEKRCDELLSKIYPCDECFLCMTLSGNLKFQKNSNYITLHHKSFEIDYIKWTGSMYELEDFIEKVKQCYNENKDTFKLLLLSYQIELEDE